MTGAVGCYGSDYPFRAAFALLGTGPNRPEDVIYMSKDGEAQQLRGTNRYTITFAKDMLFGPSRCMTETASEFRIRSTVSASATATSSSSTPTAR